jgi:DNA-binding MarR family transcriptional regulator
LRYIDDFRRSMNERGQVARAATQQPGVLGERLASPGLLLALLGQGAMRRLRAAHTAVGLAPRQFQLLGLLHDNGPMGQRELGETMGIDPSILVTMLNPLEEGGLITRRRDAVDRRRHTVLLTDSGAKQLRRAARAQREAEDELFAGLDDDQRDQLRQLLLAVWDPIVVGECAGQEPPAC